MTVGNMFFKIAQDEAQTLSTYQSMLEEVDATEEEKAIVKEIMSDELNHCLLALVAAAKVLGIQIATDDITSNPNNIEVE